MSDLARLNKAIDDAIAELTRLRAENAALKAAVPPPPVDEQPALDQVAHKLEVALGGS